MSSTFSIKHCDTTVTGRYALQAPSESAPAGPLILGFHGYAQTCEHLIPAMQTCFGDINPTICSIQGLSYFYRKNGEVVASWMTKLDRELAIRNNIRYIEGIWSDITADKEEVETIFFGFSQGAAMAYRMTLLSAIPHTCTIAVAGELPPELHTPENAGSLAKQKIIVCRGSNDSVFTSEQFSRDVAELKRMQESVVAITYEGGHEINDSLADELSAELPYFNSRKGTSKGTRQ